MKNYGAGFADHPGIHHPYRLPEFFFYPVKLFNLFDSWLEKTPGIKYIYSSVRDFFGAFAGEKKKFNKPILANAFADDVWIMGFLTDEELEKFDMGAEMVSVYIPRPTTGPGSYMYCPGAG